MIFIIAANFISSCPIIAVNGYTGRATFSSALSVSFPDTSVADLVRNLLLVLSICFLEQLLEAFIPAKPEKDINGAEVDETAYENITETLNS
jgi:hypothetical protein